MAAQSMDVLRFSLPLGVAEPARWPIPGPVFVLPELKPGDNTRRMAEAYVPPGTDLADFWPAAEDVVLLRRVKICHPKSVPPPEGWWVAKPSRGL